MQPAVVEVKDGTIIHTFRVLKEHIQHEAEKRLNILRNYVNDALPGITFFAGAVKDQLLDAARQPLRQRHNELQADKKALEQFKNLGFPIRQRSDEVAKTYVPVQRKVIAVPDSPRQLEENPFITMQAYEDILSTITAMAHGFERSPSAFRGM